MRDLAVLVLGWLLGLLGPIINDAIRDRKTAAQARRAIRVELEELRYRLAAVVYQVADYLGTFDRALAEWLQMTVTAYRGAYKSEGGTIDLRPLVEATDEQLSSLNNRSRATSEMALTFRKYQLPFLDANLNQASNFSAEEQASLFEIRAQLQLFHDLVDDARFYHQLTFESLSDVNRRNVESNVKRVHALIAERARGLADRIGGFLSKGA